MDKSRELTGAAEELENSVYRKPGWSRHKPDGGSVAAERPFCRTAAKPGVERVSDDVKKHGHEVRITFDFDAVRPVPEKVRGTSMPPISPNGMRLVQYLETT